ncbi:MAG: ATP-binding protein [Bacteroidota bacterium]
MAFQDARQIDTSQVLLSQLVQELEAAGLGESRLALEAELCMAENIIKGEEDLAINQLLSISEKALKQGEWKILAQTHINLALVYELLLVKDKCKQQLDQAFSLIMTHKLRSLFPLYNIRKSSYFRILDQHPDSAYFFAGEAIRTSEDRITEEKATAYFLIAVLDQDASLPETIGNLNKSAAIYLSLNIEQGYAAMLRNISNKYQEAGELDSAKHYCQLALNVLVQCKPPYTVDYFFTKSILFWGMADYFRQKGQVDSTWKYVQLYDNITKELNVRLNASAVAETEAKFYDEKKSQQILEQERKIKDERQGRNAALGGLSAALLFSFILGYFYLQITKANKKIKEQSESLSQLDEAKSRFFANISHELRTPLTLILGPLQSLSNETNLSQNQQRLLAMASKSGEQLQELINEILTLRKLTTGKLRLEVQPTALYSFLYSILIQFNSLADIKSIDFSFEIELRKGVQANIDQGKVRQILNNLLSNAFKYTPLRGKVRCHVQLTDGELHITVTDSGEGIHPDDQPYIFDRFFQSKRPEKLIEGGTGIGLALCKEYVNLMEGSIELNSKLGRGSSFMLVLPLEVLDEKVEEDMLPDVAARGHEEAETSLTDQQPVPTSELPKVLLVEDNIELATYLELILAKDYQVTMAANGQEAWEHLAKEVEENNHSTYDLVLSDLMMPLMDGYQLAEKLKSQDQTRHTPLIMLTARADIQDKLQALRIGVDDYILKPFNEAELKLKMNNLLQNYHARLATSMKEVEAQNEKEDVPQISKEDQGWLAEFEKYVRENISDSRMDVPMLAEKFAMSESTLLRQLKRLTGLSPKKYLVEVKLQKARQLLEAKTYNSISRVAYESGYADPKSFSRAFKRKFGKLPSVLIES